MKTDEENYEPHQTLMRAARETDALLNSTSLTSDHTVSKEMKLSIWTAMVFIIGEMAGSGVVALPQAIENAGWIGLVVLAFCCLATGWCGILLGKCWMILEERFPQYQDHCRDPYPSIGYEAFGKPGKYLVTACIHLTLFGVSIVFLILAASNLHLIFSNVHHMNFSGCYWMLIVAVLLTPFVWLGTPKDFWPIAIGASVATGIACIFLIAAIATDSDFSASKVTHRDVEIKPFALAFGTILFSFGGAPAFPTIQHDMKRSAEFPKAVLLGFSGLALMYIPVCSVGYFLMGDKLKDNVLDAIPKNWMFYTVQVLIVAHLLFAFTIIINPLCQEFEKVLKIPIKFSWKRALFRTFCVLLVLFVAESVPHFGPILSLIGGSTNTLLSIILPCVFYLKLSSMENRGWPDRSALLHEKLFSIEIITLGVIGGVITTYSAIDALSEHASLVPPCYLNSTDF